MFFEFLTKRNEKVCINICCIQFITSTKNGTLIMDNDGNEFETLEPFDSLVLRLRNLKPLNSDKTCNNGAI